MFDRRWWGSNPVIFTHSKLSGMLWRQSRCSLPCRNVCYLALPTPNLLPCRWFVRYDVKVSKPIRTLIWKRTGTWIPGVSSNHEHHYETYDTEPLKWKVSYNNLFNWAFLDIWIFSLLIRLTGNSLNVSWMCVVLFTPGLATI